MNKVILSGFISRDLELKQGKTKPFCNFTVAAKTRKETEFVDCIVFGEMAENLCKFMKKGNRVDVCGRIQKRSYEKDGKKFYITEVICDDIEFASPMDGKKKEEKDDFEPLDDEQMPF